MASIEYDINIKINDKDLGVIDPALYNFSMEDSIHTLYSQCSFNQKDPFGILKQSALLIEGNNVSIYFEHDDDFIENKYVVDNTSSDSNDTVPGRLDGTIKTKLINKFLTSQVIESAAYNDLSSSVIRLILSNEEFNKKNIEVTNDKKIWYRPLMKQEAFFKKIILPVAYSDNSNDSAMFCFIDNNNEFNFKSYNQMFSENIVDSFQMNLESTQTNEFLSKNILQFLPFSSGSTILFPLRNKKTFNINNDDGTLEEIDSYINSYPTTSQNKKITLRGSKTNTTSYEFQGIKSTPIETHRKAQYINNFRNCTMVDRAVVVVPLNLKIKAGKTVELKLPGATDVTDKEQRFYSGKYLVEESSHIWNGQNGLTSMIVSKQLTNMSVEYIYYKELYS